MKKKLASIILLGTMIISSVPVSAAISEGTSGGSINADDFRYTRAANHSTPGGGDWYWGYDGNTLFSSYCHKTLMHSAYAESKNGKDSSGWKNPQPSMLYYADASVKSSLSGNIVKWDTK